MIESIVPTRSHMQTALQTQFSLEPDYESFCSHYYILHWQGNHFKRTMKSGIISRGGVDYLVVYKDCGPASIKDDSKIYLSFRNAIPRYNLRAYVLISIGF